MENKKVIDENKRNRKLIRTPPAWFFKEIYPQLMYDPARGTIKWKVLSGLKTHKPLGHPIGEQYKRYGHSFVSSAGETYVADMANLAWTMLKGKWPKHAIQLADGDPSNLRADNLVYVINVPKVYVSKVGNVFKAAAKIQDKTVHLGSWPTEDEARTKGMLKLKTKLMMLKRQQS